MRFLSDDLLFWGKTVGVTGSGPYDEMAIERIAILEGAVVGDFDIWQTNQIVIVGREAFDEDYLMKSVEFGLSEGFTCRYLSQEDFWDYWLGGEETTYYAGDPRIASHEGLSFIASIGFRWPSIEIVQGFGGTGSVADRLNPAHQLKSRFGYSVKAGVSAKERRQRLGRAVSGSGALERWGFRLSLVGMWLAVIGVFTDYWVPVPPGFWLVLVGTLPLVAGFVLLGVGWPRVGAVPLWVTLVMVGAAVATFPVMFLLVFHLPSGPLLTFHLIWVALGYILWSGQGILADQPSRVR